MGTTTAAMYNSRETRTPRSEDANASSYSTEIVVPETRKKEQRSATYHGSGSFRKTWLRNAHVRSALKPRLRRKSLGGAIAATFVTQRSRRISRDDRLLVPY